MARTDIIYHNLSLTNNQSQPILASITDQRQSPILGNPSEWEMSIVRFQVSGDLIPLFHPIIPNPAFPLVTNMSITLSFGGVFFQEFINITNEMADNGVFFYGPYLDQLNTAANAAFVILKAAFPAAPQTAPPIFVLNPVTQLISMYVQDSYIQTSPTSIGIGLNQYLQAILDFPYSQFNGYSTPFGYDYVIDVDNAAILTPPPPRSGYPFAISIIAGNVLQVSQEFPTLHLWDNVKSIIFITSLIPIVKEALPNSVSLSQNNNISNNTQSVLTDFDFVKDISEPRPSIIQYTPPGEYRMISMNQANAYSVSDVQAQYSDYNGDTFPIYLNSGTNMSLKIMYRRKPNYYK